MWRLKLCYAASAVPLLQQNVLPLPYPGKGSTLLYPFRSSPLVAITFLYQPKDFFL